MFSKVDTLKSFDKEIYATILKENRRQEENLELIASENYVSYAVMEAQGSQLTNKYAEGYPGKRYYGGCEYVDIIENIAIERLKKLFNAGYVNVQPHSGSQANQAVYACVLKPGDTILGMSLAHGGHLTHGASANISGKLYNAVSYGLDDFEMINYKQILELAHQHQPKIIVAGASSYSLTFDWQKFRDIADEVDAYLLVDMAHYAGLIAAGEYPNPVPIADFVTTTTHKTLRGARGGAILCKDDTFAKQLNLAIFPSIQGGPLMHAIAAKAVCFKEAATENFREYIIQVKKNAKLLANTLKNRKFRIVSGTTETHMFLIDLQQKEITGKEAEAILGNANITVNKNAIPNDPQTPFITSGIRLGTAAITTRGFKEKEIEIVANLIADVLDNPKNTEVHERAKKEVIKLCRRFPVYQSTLII